MIAHRDASELQKSILEVPDGSRCIKRELGSLHETHFAVMLVRSAHEFQIVAISKLRNRLVRVYISYQ